MFIPHTKIILLVAAHCALNFQNTLNFGSFLWGELSPVLLSKSIALTKNDASTLKAQLRPLILMQRHQWRSKHPRWPRSRGGGADPKGAHEGRWGGFSEEEKERNIGKLHKNRYFWSAFPRKNRNFRARYARKLTILLIFESTGAPKKVLRGSAKILGLPLYRRVSRGL